MWDQCAREILSWVYQKAIVPARAAIQNTCRIRFIQKPNCFTLPARRLRQSSFERFRITFTTNDNGVNFSFLSRNNKQ